MADFYIRQLTVSGDDVKPTVIDFEQGTNIIYGSSDIGKSYIVECLDFLFGAKNMRLKYTSGYSTVSAVIQTSQGEIRLERRFDVRKKSVSISSTDPRYKHFGGTGFDRDVLDSLWLRLIGIGENQTVVVNGDYAHELLKWNNIKQMLLIKETNVSATKSVIPGSTKSLSTLLFLLTGKDFADVPPRESDADRRKRLKGAREQILKQMRDIASRQQILLDQMNSEPVETSQQEWMALLDRFSVQEQQMQAAIRESHDRHAKLDEAQKALSAYKLQQESYRLLQGLYGAQMKRLAMTMEGQILTLGHGEDCKCPYCGHKAKENEISPDVLNAAKAEIEQTEIAIHHFQDAKEDLQKKIERHEKLVVRLQEECAVIDMKISAAYAPSVAEMKERLEQYTENVKRQNELDILGVDYATLDSELASLNAKDDEDALKFRPKEEFPPEFFSGMASGLTRLLMACGYSADDLIDFEPATMDISINYQDKSTYGEGYRAFLNTAVAFCLFRYLCEQGMHVPGLLIIDSPIQAMREKEGTHLTKQLFNYIYDRSKCGQVIIVDNRIPDDSDVANAHVIPLRESGFLPDFVRPTKKRKKRSPAQATSEGQISIDDL